MSLEKKSVISFFSSAGNGFLTAVTDTKIWVILPQYRPIPQPDCELIF